MSDRAPEPCGPQPLQPQVTLDPGLTCPCLGRTRAPSSLCWVGASMLCYAPACFTGPESVPGLPDLKPTAASASLPWGTLCQTHHSEGPRPPASHVCLAELSSQSPKVC